MIAAKKRIFVVALLLLLPIAIISPSLGQCLDDKIRAFGYGEKVEYEVYYNWGLIWVNAGEVFFSVQRSMHNEKPAYHFVSQGKSKPNYDWLYKVRDKYESKVLAASFQPVWFSRDTYEGKYKVDEEYFYLPDENKVAVSLVKTDMALQKDTLSVSPCTFDVLTMVYHARTIDFDKYNENDKIPINVLMDGESHNLYVRYLGKEIVETREKKKYKCIKFKPLLVEGSIFQGGEDMTVWVTDDSNKIPIMVEAKILVGSIKAFLSKTTGIKNPQSALIN